MRLRAIFLSASSLTLMCGAAAAQTAASPSASANNGTTLSELVITAERRTTALQKTAIAATVVTGNLFHRSSPDDALETARADPRLRRIIARHLRLLERRAESLVTEHRDAIVAVADELARTRHLSGDAVRAIVERVRGRAPSH